VFDLVDATRYLSTVNEAKATAIAQQARRLCKNSTTGVNDADVVASLHYLIPIMAEPSADNSSRLETLIGSEGSKLWTENPLPGSLFSTAATSSQKLKAGILDSIDARDLRRAVSNYWTSITADNDEASTGDVSLSFLLVNVRVCWQQDGGYKTATNYFERSNWFTYKDFSDRAELLAYFEGAIGDDLNSRLVRRLNHSKAANRIASYTRVGLLAVKESRTSANLSELHFFSWANEQDEAATAVSFVDLQS